MSRSKNMMIFIFFVALLAEPQMQGIAAAGSIAVSSAAKQGHPSSELPTLKAELASLQAKIKNMKDKTAPGSKVLASSQFDPCEGVESEITCDTLVNTPEACSGVYVASPSPSDVTDETGTVHSYGGIEAISGNIKISNSVMEQEECTTTTTCNAGYYTSTTCNGVNCDYPAEAIVLCNTISCADFGYDCNASTATLSGSVWLSVTSASEQQWENSCTCTVPVAPPDNGDGTDGGDNKGGDDGSVNTDTPTKDVPKGVTGIDYAAFALFFVALVLFFVGTFLEGPGALAAHGFGGICILVSFILSIVGMVTSPNWANIFAMVLSIVLALAVGGIVSKGGGMGY